MLCLLGDFNETIAANERLGQQTDDEDSKDFRSMLRTAKLSEMPTLGGFFTWSNKDRGENWKESNIVQVFVNNEWSTAWPNVKCQLYNGGSSDHLALMVKLCESD